jgi:hypothetical protein
MSRINQTKKGKKKKKPSWAWWHTPLIPALGRQRQADSWVRGQPGLQSEFQDSQGYREKPCFKKKKKKKENKRINQVPQIRFHRKTQYATWRAQLPREDKLSSFWGIAWFQLNRNFTGIFGEISRQGDGWAQKTVHFPWTSGTAVASSGTEQTESDCSLFSVPRPHCPATTLNACLQK